MEDQAKSVEKFDKYRQKYVAFLDILGFSSFTMEADKSVEKRMEVSQALARMKFPFQSNSAKGFYSTQFSDCIVFSAERNIEGLKQILFAASGTVLNLLGVRLLVRGGIVLGNIHHGSKIVFGPGLIEAARYDKSGSPPRILLSTQVLKDLEKHSDGEENLLSKFVRNDCDDQSEMLHYLRMEEKHEGDNPNGNGLILEPGAAKFAEYVATQCSNRNLNGSDRKKWIWMQNYWNRTVDIKGILKRST